MRHLSIALALSALAACSGEPPSQPESPAEDAAEPEPIAGRDSSASTARPEPGEVPAEAGNPLTFTAGADWVEGQPSSSMRLAQYTLPGAEGAGAAELVVFYFGADQGGSVEHNIQRWASQFEQPDGSDTLERIERSERRVLGMPVHGVAFSGTFVAETTPGSGERVSEPGWRMLAAIVESDHGPYYLKLTGPEASVNARTGEFRAFVTELR